MNKDEHQDGPPVAPVNTLRRRFPEVEVTVEMARSSFIQAPRVEQRSWVTNLALDELIEELLHLDVVAPGFIGGATRAEIDQGAWAASSAEFIDGELLIEDQQVMQDWELQLMKRMAEVVTQHHGDVLEIGFGLALSAGFIEECGVRSHTIVEFNEEVAAVAHEWAAQRSNSDIEIIHGSWQDKVKELGIFDGILWDAFPTSEREFDQYVVRDSTVAESFFPTASAHLRTGGVFTYYTNERDSLSRRHQRSLLRYFSSFNLEVVDQLRPPDDCEYWWADRMCVVTAVK